MLSSSVVGNGSRPPWWRTAIFALVAMFFSFFSLAFSPLGRVISDSDHLRNGELIWGLLTLFSAIALPSALFWRHRHPFILTLVAAGAALVIPVGNSVALIGLGALIGRRRGPAVWWTTGVVAITATTVALRDLLTEPRGASFWKSMLGDPSDVAMSQTTEFPIAWAVTILVLQLVVPIGLGFLVRARRDALSATQSAKVEQETSARLNNEAARRQERERVAREVHDAMGYRLGLLNLHAGALEANSAHDPRVAESARLIRETASATMEDLRSLLDMLREPLHSDQPSLPLTELTSVVQDWVGVGQPMSSSIFIENPEQVDPQLSRAVYRIVQELLTNARKHAPGQPVFLQVTGNPSTGIVVDVRNRYVGSVPGPPGSSRGLTGLTERAEIFGGTVRFGLDGPMFRVHVELPWRTSSTLAG